MENCSNIILFDWLTVTFKHLSVYDVQSILHMQHDVSWTILDSYMNGYPSRLSFSGINILYGASDAMGVCLTMSGQGCRAFESFGSGDWSSLFYLICQLQDEEECNITRFDIAYDDHSGIIPLDEVLDDTDDHNYISKSRWWKVEYGSEGSTIYHGSPKSNTRIRIYDKAAERGLHDGSHWIRVEIQLRDFNAFACIHHLLDDSVGSVFCGILKNYLTYRVPTSDSNKSRWPLTDYWYDLIGDCEAISVWVKPGIEYNIWRMERWLVDQCGAAISCYADILGLDTLVEQIKLKHVRISPKYEKLKKEFGK